MSVGTLSRAAAEADGNRTRLPAFAGTPVLKTGGPTRRPDASASKRTRRDPWSGAPENASRTADGDDGRRRRAGVMDVHRNMKGVTSEQLLEAHNADLAIQGDEKANFKHAWADPPVGHGVLPLGGPQRRGREADPRAAGHPADDVYEVPVQA